MGTHVMSQCTRQVYLEACSRRKEGQRAPGSSQSRQRCHPERPLSRAEGSLQFIGVMKRANYGDPSGPAAAQDGTFRQL